MCSDTPHVAMQKCRHERAFLDFLKYLFDAFQKVIAQAGPLPFVPSSRLAKILFGDRANDDAVRHRSCRNRAFTSSQLDPE